MDTRSFDQLAVAMASGSSRRQVLGGLAAALGLSVAVPVAAKKGGNGKGNGGNGGNGGGNAYGRNKVGVCHKTGDGFAYKLLPKPALKGHLKHGDFLCVPEGAADDPCRTFTTTCDETAGSCTVGVNEGAACTDVNGAAGTCDIDGVCTVVGAPPPTGE